MNPYTTIRENIILFKQHQDVSDFNQIKEKLEGSKASVAVLDIIGCNKIPVLRSSDNQSVKERKLSTTSLASLHSNSRSINHKGSDTGSSKNNSSNKSVRTNNLSFDGSNDEVHSKRTLFLKLSKEKKKPSIGESQKDEKNVISLDSKLSVALKYLNDAKEVLDPSRLYYEAAVLFDDLGMLDRACSCYSKATKQTDPALIVDMYDLPNDLAYKRKVERMSPFQLKDFLENRLRQRESLILEESERQRLRARSSYCQMVRIKLLDFNELIGAHNAIRHAFLTCRSNDEHIEVLFFMHETIKKFASLQLDEMPLSSQIGRLSAGPIAEAHINILHELETIYPNECDILEWLGMRYAERCDFETSKQFYQKRRELQNPSLDMKDTLELWRTPSSVNNDSEPSGKELQNRAEVFENINKKLIAQHGTADSNTTHPSNTLSSTNRQDFAWFAGVHKDANISIYKIPPQGWNTISNF
eukprot:gene12089-16176_t